MEEDHHRGPEISPVFIGLVGILAGAIIVATLHCISINWCRLRQSSNPTDQHQIATINHRVLETSRSTSTSTSTSTSNSSAQLIRVYRYSKECKESTCAVCLSDFKEGEEVRVLPECAHQFHVLCVDMWLLSHPNCPLCRAHTTALQRHVVVSLPDSGGFPPPEFSRMPDFGG